VSATSVNIFITSLADTTARRQYYSGSFSDMAGSTRRARESLRETELQECAHAAEESREQAQHILEAHLENEEALNRELEIGVESVLEAESRLE